MKNLLILGGLGAIAYTLFGNKIRQALQLAEINTFRIVSVKNLKIHLPNANFTLVAEYVNNTDITLPIDNLVVKIYRVTVENNQEVESEIGNSQPTLGVTFPARQTTKFDIPLSVGLMNIATSFLSLVSANPLIRVKAWITSKGQQVMSETDINLIKQK